MGLITCARLVASKLLVSVHILHHEGKYDCAKLGNYSVTYYIAQSDTLLKMTDRLWLDLTQSDRISMVINTISY